MTPAQTLLQVHLREIGVDTISEYKFAPSRKFRFDLYSERLRIGFECDGGQFHGGHRRSKAWDVENEKQNLAQMLGYKIMRFTNREVETGKAKEFLKEWLEAIR